MTTEATLCPRCHSLEAGFDPGSGELWCPSCEYYAQTGDQMRSHRFPAVDEQRCESNGCRLVERHAGSHALTPYPGAIHG